SLLGEDWVLGPSSRFAALAFEIVSPRLLTPEERRRLRQIVDYLKPAQTHFARLVEPTLPETIDHVELGISELGENWVLHPCRALIAIASYVSSPRAAAACAIGGGNGFTHLRT